MLKYSIMSDNRPIFPLTDTQVIESMRAEIEKAEESGDKRPIEKFVLAALSSIPWIGSFVSAAASLKSVRLPSYLYHQSGRQGGEGIHRGGPQQAQ